MYLKSIACQEELGFVKWKMFKFKTKYRFLTRDGRGNVFVSQFIPWNNKKNNGAKQERKAMFSETRHRETTQTRQQSTDAKNSEIRTRTKIAPVWGYVRLWSPAVRMALYKLGAQSWKGHPRIYPWTDRIWGLYWLQAGHWIQIYTSKRSRVRI